MNAQNLGDVMAVAENITEATVPDTTGKTTVAPVTETTVPDTTGETTVTIVHKDNNVVKLPLGPGLFFLTHYFLTMLNPFSPHYAHSSPVKSLFSALPATPPVMDSCKFPPQIRFLPQSHIA